MPGRTLLCLTPLFLSSPQNETQPHKLLSHNKLIFINGKRMDIDTLIHEIKQAFGDSPPPKDKEILRKGMAKAEYGGNKTAGLGGVRWLDLPERFYSKETNWYSWPWLDDLTPLAFCYFLPGYMIIAAQHYSKCDSDHVVQNLIIDNKYFHEKDKSDLILLGRKSADEKRKTFELFSVQQKHAIRLFLEYLIAEYAEDIKFSEPKDTPQEALAQYWNKY